ncbi:TPA: toprim domain-containing protein [Candidatus Bipolaricaulota bacterium]|nr:toprim domain-containing protein [Candidatus Bipolaricaulota bacterium]
MITREEIEEIRARFPVEQVIGSYIQLRRSGRTLVGHCPFHEDKVASLTVYPQTRSWYCFGCGAGGDVFEFVKHIEHVRFPEAVGLLAGGKLKPRRIPPPSAEPIPELTLTEEHFAVLTAAVEAYHAALLARPDLLQHLAGRGIDGEAVKRHRLGYASGKRLVRYLQFRGWDPQLAADLGLIGPKGEFFRERIVIPEIREGRAVYLVGRALRPSQRAKYLHLPGAPKPIYGLECIQGRHEIFVTEGPFDWMTLISWGFPACALLGHSLKKDQQRHFESATRIYLCLDNDEAGRRGTRELRELWGERARPVPHLKGVKDINELAQRPNGRELFTGLVRLADRRAWRRR